MQSAENTSIKLKKNIVERYCWILFQMPKKNLKCHCPAIEIQGMSPTSTVPAWQNWAMSKSRVWTLKHPSCSYIYIYIYKMHIISYESYIYTWINDMYVQYMHHFSCNEIHCTSSQKKNVYHEICHNSCLIACDVRHAQHIGGVAGSESTMWCVIQNWDQFPVQTSRHATRNKRRRIAKTYLIRVQEHPSLCPQLSWNSN